MKVDDLIAECALHVDDPDMQQISPARWLIFLRSAAGDLRNKGWMVRQDDDTSLTVLANTFTYAVPAGFAYIKELRAEEVASGVSAYIREVPLNHWTIHTQTIASVSTPVFFFFTLTSLEVGRKLLIVGQKRPTLYTATNQAVDPGMESFLRERACAYALQSMAAGVSELSRWRQVLAGQKFQNSEVLLRNHPQEFRVLPNSIVVPGRE